MPDNTDYDCDTPLIFATVEDIAAELHTRQNGKRFVLLIEQEDGSILFAHRGGMNIADVIMTCSNGAWWAACQTKK